MDRTVKFLLFVIAASLVMLNLQLAGVGLVKDARAEIDSADISIISSGLSNIASVIAGIDCSR